MYGYIDGYDFGEMEAMKYYAPSSSWSDQKKKDHAHSCRKWGWCTASLNP